MTTQTNRAMVSGMNLVVDRVANLLSVLHDFSRPHVLYAAFFTIFCNSAVIYFATGGEWHIHRALQLLCIIVLAGIAIVGLNQVIDVDVDRINKPFLPMAAGRLSVAGGITIVSMCLVLCGLMGYFWLQSAFLNTLLWTLLMIGFIYSLPFFNARQSLIFPSLFIVIDRAVIFNSLCYGYLSTKNHNILSGQTIDWNAIITFYSDPALAEIIRFTVLYVFVISVFKDVPDMSGDKVHKRATIPLILGRTNSMLACYAVLAFNYLAYYVLYFVYYGQPNSFLDGHHILIAGYVSLSIANCIRRILQVQAWDLKNKTAKSNQTIQNGESTQNGNGHLQTDKVCDPEDNNEKEDKIFITQLYMSLWTFFYIHYIMEAAMRAF